MEFSATHTTSMKVRDYECDSGGGVNNSVYLNYLEHARFEYLRDFLSWNVEDLQKIHHIGFVVIHMEISFKRSLMPNQKFSIESTLSRPGKRRFRFQQEIFIDSPTGDQPRKPIVSAAIMCTAVNLITEKSETPQILESLLVDFPIIEVVAV